jgi:hypothetical protein
MFKLTRIEYLELGDTFGDGSYPVTNWEKILGLLTSLMTLRSEDALRHSFLTELTPPPSRTQTEEEFDSSTHALQKYVLLPSLRYLFAQRLALVERNFLDATIYDEILVSEELARFLLARRRSNMLFKGLSFGITEAMYEEMETFIVSILESYELRDRENSGL